MTTTGVRSGQLLTGEAYLESLRDAREVYLDGERVHDVTTHPAFAKSARTVARLYDALHDPEHRDTLVGTDRDGIVTHEFFRPAYTVEDLRRGAEAVKLWSQMSYGWMGRTPDYKAAFMATLGADPSFYAPFEETGRKWYREYATKGLFLNHVLINPPIDRDKAVHEVEDVYVHKVGETDEGIIVSGAKMLATGSVLTQATFVAQNAQAVMEKGKSEDYALVSAMLGEVVAWRTMIWAIVTALINDTQPGPGGTIMPAQENAAIARIFGTMAWPRIKQTFLQILGGSPLVVPAGPNDLTSEEIGPLVERFYRGSTGDAHDRVKLFKLIWDAIGSEFGGRHELYEMNYCGNHEQVRLDMLSWAGKRGLMAGFTAMVEQCMSDYDLEGFTAAPWADA